jgi:hypothetical protein
VQPVLTAEGVKQSAILTAQGEKEAQILRAEGSAQARVLEAQGQAQAIQQVFDAIHRGKPTQRLLAYQYLQVLPQLARGDANKMWIIPSELTDALRGVSSALGGNSSGAALEEEWVEPAPAPAAAPPIQRAKQFGEPEVVGDVHADPPRHPAGRAAAASSADSGFGSVGRAPSCFLSQSWMPSVSVSGPGAWARPRVQAFSREYT